MIVGVGCGVGVVLGVELETEVISLLSMTVCSDIK